MKSTMMPAPEAAASSKRRRKRSPTFSVTLEQVARLARVSTATVSRVLNNSPKVRDETRRRVLRAVRQLNYLPNYHAQLLAGGGRRTLGMIISNIENPFFLEIFGALEARALQAGYEVVLENTNYERNRLVRAVRSMLARRVAGLAVIVSEIDPQLFDDLRRQNIPIVFYDVGQPGPNITNIRVRYEKGMQRVIEYLYSLGHRRMAFIGHHAALSPLQERRRTFLQTVRRFPDVDYTTVSQADGPAGGRAAAAQLLDSGFRPTAIVCVNDVMAVGVIRELRDRGLDVPRDVSVTGFDNIHLSEFLCPSLTTLNIPRRRIGQMAFDLLTSPAEQVASGQEILIDPELVVRESTGPAPQVK